MAKNQGQINFGIGFNVNTASLNQVRNTLKELKAMSGEQIKQSGGHILDLDKSAIHSWKNNLHAMRDDVSALERAFEAAYNPKLGTYELNKFNESLKGSGTTAAQAFATVANYGAQGKAAILDMTTSMLAFERVGKQTNETFKKLSETMLNTIRWSITSSALNTITSAISQAFHYAVDLDGALNDIMIVTDKSSREMEQFARSANKAAKELGTSTKDYAEASLIYYQQGLGEKDTKARTETTLKAAAITGQSANQVSEQLTAVWNGYKVSAKEAELYIDKLSAVAATTGADLEELSVGMSKVASAANIMGVDADQLNAQLATIVSVTREAPESIGTALKTVYARMSDIEAGLDTETTLGEYTSQMQAMGINVLDANEKLRDMGAVVEEIGNKWSSLNREQQVSLAQSIAGTRQYSRMMALFDNWDMYQEAMTTSMESIGTLSAQHIKYLNSIEAHQKKLKASAEGLYDTIFDSDQIKGVYDLLSSIITLVNGLVKGLGGMPGILATIALFLTTFGKQSIQNLITQRANNKLQIQLYKSQIEAGKAVIESLREQAQGNEVLEQQLKGILDLEDMILNNAGNLTEEQFNNLQAGVKQYSDNLKGVIEVEKQYNAVKAEKDIWNEETGKGQRLQRTFKENGERIVSYDLREEDSKHQKLGRAQAGKNLRALQSRANAGQELSKREQEELDFLKKYLPLAEKKQKLDQELAELAEAKAKVEEETANKNDQLAESLKKTISMEQMASRVADVTQGLTQAGFSAAMAAGSVQSFGEAINNSEAGLTDWIGALSGGIGALGSLIGQGFSVRSTLHKVKTDNLTGAAAWSAYWSAATFGISLLVTGLTTVLSIVGEIEQAKIDEANAIIEGNRERQQEIKTNLDLQKSYLELYKTYKETGEVTNEMVTAAEQVAEALEDEGLAALIAAGRYDELAAAIQAKRNQNYADLRESAKKEKSAAEDKLNTIRAGNVSGMANAMVSHGIDATYINAGITGGVFKDENNAINRAILMDLFNGTGLLTDDTDPVNGDLFFKDVKEMSPDEKVLFYNTLSKATGHDNWKSEGRLADNVQEILQDEDFKGAVEDYNTATKSYTVASAQEEISGTSYSSMSLATFQEQRERLISQAQKEGGLDRNTAATRIDAAYTLEGNPESAALLERAKWLKGWEDKGIDIAEWTKALDLENVDEQIFNALQTMDLSKYQGKSVKAIISAAQEKAFKTLDEAWATETDARLKSIDTRLERLNDKQEKALGYERLELIEEENDLLVKQHEILVSNNKLYREAVQEDTQDFYTLARELGWKVTGELIAAINDQDWESVRAQIDAAFKNSPDSVSQLQTALLALNDSTNTYNEALEETKDNEAELYAQRLEQIEAIFEAYGIEIEYLSSVDSLIEKEANLHELIYGARSTSERAGFAIEDTQNAIYLQRGAEAQYAAAKAAYDNMMANPDAYIDATERNTIIKNYAKYTEAYVDAVSNTIQKAQEEYALQTQKAFEDFEKKIAGSTFDEMKEEWDWVTAMDDKYLDAVEKEYGLEKMMLKFQKEINPAASLKAQNAINNLMQEEVTMLKQKDRLSQYDLDRAEARLEVLQAQLALEDTAAQKTKTRLVRKADGSYGYEYVADVSAIAAAEEDLLNANESLYALDKEKYRESLYEFYSMYEEFRNKAIELAKQGYSPEEIAERLKPYTDELMRMAKDSDVIGVNLQDTMSKALTNVTQTGTSMLNTLNTSLSKFMKGFIGEDGKPGDIPADLEKLIDAIETRYQKYSGIVSSESTVAAKIIKDTKEALTDQASLLTAAKSGLDVMASAYERMNTALGGILEKLNELNKLENNGTVTVSAHPSGLLSGVSGQNNNTLIQAFDNGSGAPVVTRKKGEVSSYAQVSSEAKERTTALSTVIDSDNEYTAGSVVAMKANTTILDSLGSKINLEKGENVTILGDANGAYLYAYKGERYYKVSSQHDEFYVPVQQIIHPLQFSRTTSLIDGLDGFELDTDSAYTIYPRNGSQAISISNNALNNHPLTLRSNVIRKDAQGVEYIAAAIGKPWSTERSGLLLEGVDEYWVPIKQINKLGSLESVSFDTGGYTGNWHSSEGRVAMLHEKEIVLNKTDTANLLKGIDILRQLDLSMLRGVTALMGATSASQAALSTAHTGVIDQNIVIHAEFPNVSVKDEIEEAFSELINLAAQYAASKK